MSNVIEKLLNSQGHTVEIFLDDTPINPREDDNIGTMCLFHKKYNLGDEHDFSPETLESFLNENEVVWLNVYAYDHGSLTIKTSPFSCPWDSGKLGVIFVTKEEVIENFGDFSKESIAKSEKCLQAEVSLYEEYLQGNVYGFRILEGDKEIDACWGFYGNDHKESGLLDAANS